MNTVKTTLLLGVLSGLLLLAGQAIGGPQGMTIGLLLAIGMNFFSYFFSDKFALMSSGAVPVSETENSEVYGRLAPVVKRLCERMGLPMPRLYVIPEESPNAFATGRNPQHSAVAVTVGLLQIMNDQELAGVIAHELGHVKNRDILISSIAATLGSALTFLARMAMFFGPRRDDEEDGGGLLGGILMMILAPIAALLIQMAISRTREYGADAAAARYTGSPEGLVSALRKLEGWSKQIPMDVSPATAHMYIVQPFTGSSLLKLFSTHPSTEDRIARLRSLPAVAR